MEITVLGIDLGKTVCSLAGIDAKGYPNNRRLLGPIGYIPPAEAEEAFYAYLNSLDMVA